MGELRPTEVAGEAGRLGLEVELLAMVLTKVVLKDFEDYYVRHGPRKS